LGKPHSYAFAVEARYRFQVWDLEIPVGDPTIGARDDVDNLVEEFHRMHERVFAVRDEESIVEFLNWKGRVTVHLERPCAAVASVPANKMRSRATRPAYFGSGKRVDTPVFREGDIEIGAPIGGPSIIEMPTTTIVVYPGMSVTYSAGGNFVFDETAQGQ
jgi:N-methylhydantoinase A